MAVPRSSRKSPPSPYYQSPQLRWFLGMFPGLRLLTQHRWKDGTRYSIVGLLILLFFILILTDIPVRHQLIARYQLAKSYILFDTTALITLCLLFELLRMGADFEEYNHNDLKAPRMISVLFLPSVTAVALGMSEYTSPWTNTVQAVWVTAIFVSMGTLPATIYCMSKRPYSGTLLVVVLLITWIAMLSVTGSVNAVIQMLIEAARFARSHLS